MRYKPTNDLLFKKTFTSIGNEALLQALIQDLTGTSFEAVEVTTPYNFERFKQDAQEEAQANTLIYTEVDLRARTSTGDLVTIEMQVRFPDYFIERTQYYAYSAYVAAYADEVSMRQKRNKYSSIHSVYGINISASNLYEPHHAALRVYEMQDTQIGEPLAQMNGRQIEDVKLIYLDLTNTNLPEDSAVYHWWRFFNGLDSLPQAPAYIDRAYDLIALDNMTKEEITMINQLEYHKANSEALLATAERVGREAGIETGRKEGIEVGRESERKSTIQKMIANGMTTGQIAVILDLPIEEVEKFLENPEDSGR
ncbi:MULTISPECIES: Rpn family recombination-promoting nuclease/putative transposase [Aerococcus]|uniref:Rpn family recombination-promoting nuclease/putative transposase n=1 Tax=Aerococcus TaxID=1375 RepID=UPI000DCAEBC7|nr:MULTISPECIES: Rpn family recombination-promoting nuclease/putative transposase [Aerococcus]KAA9298837.1 Rpn family recombination-promoting nuclease/putative transposase [Aerococcus tenax]MDK6689168.1 Rpn family recombination-promoting nuclease/putative transposase [Aerococcus urinae]MDK8132983.1 Rpn family recombination-promoting nuclease/putative transposase [Aerococcus urinae]MDK8484579.1 Rpn family recombination-promoting nuclease/putative transposase [Aerococcus urinae]MDL5179426.1 Rpn 